MVFYLRRNNALAAKATSPGVIPTRVASARPRQQFSCGRTRHPDFAAFEVFGRKKFQESVFSSVFDGGRALTFV